MSASALVVKKTFLYAVVAIVMSITRFMLTKEVFERTSFCQLIL